MPVPGLHVVESGAETDELLVVLVHGALDRSGSWVRVARELRDLHTIRYDRRGYGRSRSLGGSGIETHIADLLDVIDGRACVVTGHSFGAAIALAAAERRPDVVRAVVSYEGPMSWRPWWPRTSAGGVAVDQVRSGMTMGDAAERFLRRMIGDAAWDALPERTRLERRAEGEALLIELMTTRTGEPPYEPARITVPVLSVRGTRSDEHLRRGADVLAAEVPNAELHVIEGADHGAHQGHPREMAALIRRAMARARCTPAP